MIPSENADPIPSFSEDLNTWEKFKVIVQSILRTLLGIIFIAAIVAFVPNSVDGAIWIPFGAIILVLVIYIWYFRLQLRRIHKSKYPNIQAGEALILVATMFLAIFAVTYVAGESGFIHRSTYAVLRVLFRSYGIGNGWVR